MRLTSHHLAPLVSLLLSGLAVSSFPAQPPSRPPGKFHSNRAPDKPNIILITAHNLGPADLRCYSPSAVPTPNIDRLAREGMRFDQFYAASTLGPPSRAALLTGLPPSRHGRPRLSAPALRPEQLTLAELLLQHGYRTGAIGLWDLGDEANSPNQQGFQDWIGYLTSQEACNLHPSQLWRNERPLPLDPARFPRSRLYAPNFFAFVRSNYVRVNKYFPFFLYLPCPLPPPAPEEILPSQPAPNPTQSRPEITRTAAIARLDQEIGDLLAQLGTLDIDRHTVILFTSDRARRPSPDSPSDTSRHDTLHEQNIRVPLIVRWPDRVPPNTTNQLPWIQWDLFPTVAEIAAVKPPHKTDGISFLPCLLGQEQTNRHSHLCWELNSQTPQQAVRSGPWKAIRPPASQPPELYNLSLDPGETTNLASQQPQTLQRLLRLLPAQ